MESVIKVLLIYSFLIISSESSPHKQNVLSERAITNKYRLPDNVVPSAYTIALQLDYGWETTNEFSGTVTISLTISNATEFKFHAKNLNITDLTLTKAAVDVDVTHTEADPETDFVTVTPTSGEFDDGEEYELTITYNGQLSDSAMVGFYKSSYLDKSGATKFLAATQFEEIHARTAFPSFDEPQMKATFKISISYPEGYYALSNTKGSKPTIDPTTNLTRSNFPVTTQLSTYLVAFIVADANDFKCKSANKTVFGKITPEVCSRWGYSNTDTKTQVAVDAVSSIYDILSSYTNYTLTALKKMSLAAIPDFSPGAMENWGMITFRESYLLWDAKESSNYDKQNVITVIAHELSHQWFGDMVTLKWWSDVFLNEGFATFFEYYAAALYQEDWELEKQFVIEQLQTALVTDSFDTALPLSYDVDNADYSSRFDDISYNKGGSILRMVYYFLGDLNFKNGLTDYLGKFSKSNVDPEDLWNSFDPYAQQLIGSKGLPVKMNDLMENWTTKPGYPVLEVTKVEDDIVISQKQFSLSQDASEKTEWYIPLTYTISDYLSNFNNLDTRYWLSPGKNVTLEGYAKDVDWIILNNQQVGYYRVNYDTTIWNKIVETLRTNTSTIHELNRAQIVDDQFNFARAGLTTYEDLLQFLTFLKNDDSYYTWSAAFNNFDYLFQKISNEKVRNALSTYILEQMQALSSSVLTNEEKPDDQIYTLKQVLAYSWACKLGYELCITNTRQMFDDYKSGKSISSNLKSVIYCNALRYSENLVEDFRFLWQKYLNTQVPTERVTILKALGCANTAQIRRFYLSYVLSDDIRRQDASIVFASIYTNNVDGATEALKYIYENYQEMTTHFGRPTIIASIINSASDYVVTDAQYSILQKITELEDLDENVKTSANVALARAETSLEVTKILENTFTTHFKIPTDSAVFSKNLVLLTICSLLFTFVSM